jgi:hypothetical protein
MRRMSTQSCGLGQSLSATCWGLLPRDELKVVCEALGLDTSGKEKEAIVQRILAAIYALRHAGGSRRVGLDHVARSEVRS